MANEHVGKRIKYIRPMTEAEKRLEGWEDFSGGIVLVLDDGTRLFPSRDLEGNGPGVLLGYRPGGNGTFFLA